MQMFRHSTHLNLIFPAPAFNSLPRLVKSHVHNIIVSGRFFNIKTGCSTPVFCWPKRNVFSALLFFDWKAAFRHQYVDFSTQGKRHQEIRRERERERHQRLAGHTVSGFCQFFSQFRAVFSDRLQPSFSLPPKRVVKSSCTFFQRGTATQRQG